VRRRWLALRRSSYVKDLSTQDALIDDIGALIDEALAHPYRAGIVKARIRERLANGSREVLQHDSDFDADDDAEDLWDNLPL
jgi:hypothetical protein